MSAVSSWRALLEGGPRDTARALTMEMASALRVSGHGRPPSLGQGSAGVALCLAYVGAASGDSRLMDDAAYLLGEAIEGCARARTSLELADGVAGVGWVIEHLQRTLRWSEDDPNTTTDEALVQYVGQEPWLGAWGHLDGLAGLGAYFLERLPSPRARAGLERVVLHLLEAAYGSKGLGAAWWTGPAQLPAPLQTAHRFGHYDLSVARGACGIIGLLSQVLLAGVARAEVRGLLTRAFDWVWSRRSPSGWPRFLGAGFREVPGSSEGSWEHGAMSAGAVLLRAAQALGDTGRVAEVRQWLCSVASAGTGALASGAGLSGGPVGLGHVYNRLFQQTGEAVFAERARACFQEVLEQSLRQRSLWASQPPEEHGWLSGLAGTALALWAASSTQEPAWDRLLLLSAPAGEGAP